MRKTIFFVVVSIAAFLLIFRLGYTHIVDTFNLKPRAGLRVDSTPASKVLLNGKEVGNTPYLDQNLKEGAYQLELDTTDDQASGSATWKGNVKLNGGTLSVVNRELASIPTDISGEVITLDKGKGITISSVPAGAAVNIDGQDKGQTPLTLSDVTVGEHQFILSHDNYLRRSIRAVVTDGYSMNMQVDLALSEAPEVKSSPTPLPSASATSSAQLTVLQTPTGFLRVRATASTSGTEVTRVSPGDVLDLVEDDGTWLKVKTSSGDVGYVSSQYVKKKTP
jgi:hypothetical protein